MKVIGNIIWFLLYGLWFALLHALLGVALCATVIFIPFGVQQFKIARYALRPFGHSYSLDFDKRPIMNLLWMLFCGLELAVLHVTVGVVLCITVIGIPFAKKCFKLAVLTAMPFGAMVL